MPRAEILPQKMLITFLNSYTLLASLVMKNGDTRAKDKFMWQLESVSMGMAVEINILYKSTKPLCNSQMSLKSER